MASPLSDFFSGVGFKRLSQVEVLPDLSNQHEFNGISGFRNIFGSDKCTFKAKFIYLSDEEDKIIVDDGFMTWYDARQNHPTRTEFRFYYSSNAVLSQAQVNDLVVVGVTGVGHLAVIVAPQFSTSEQQLQWLFGIENATNSFIVKDFTGNQSDIGFAGRYILSTLGIEEELSAPDYLDGLLSKFGNKFPSTKEFSEYSRSTVGDVSPIEDPDGTLMSWMEREELLFKTLEKVIVKERLKEGFGEDGTDVEEFIKLSLSIQNRRKSRAGFSFENNLAVLFSMNSVDFSHGAVTERNNKPDFVFPNIKLYHSDDVNVELLSMLGVKTTAKDRWRQILAEAAKISRKHLVTLEPAISRNQTAEMRASNLQLVIPEPLYPTYTTDQQQELLSLKEFIAMVVDKQKYLAGA